LGPFCKGKAGFLIELVCSFGVWRQKLFVVQLLNCIDGFFILWRIVNSKSIKTKIASGLGASGDLLIGKELFALIE
jgi:hypothetical protein